MIDNKNIKLPADISDRPESFLQWIGLLTTAISDLKGKDWFVEIGGNDKTIADLSAAVTNLAKGLTGGANSVSIASDKGIYLNINGYSDNGVDKFSKDSVPAYQFYMDINNSKPMMRWSSNTPVKDSVITWSSPKYLLTDTTDISGKSLFNYTSSGLYSGKVGGTTGTTNSPVDGIAESRFTLLVIKADGSENNITQLFTLTSVNRVYVRSCHLGTWSKWRSLTPIKGTGTLNSTAGRTIAVSTFNDNYDVYITMTSNPGLTMGEKYITKAAGSFTVYNSGSNNTATFDYTVQEKDI